MPVNREELAKDLETPEYQTLVKETLAKKDFIIQDKNEHTGYLDRFKQTVIESEIPAKIKEVWDRIDRDVKEIYGVDRDPNEKTYDYLKRAASAKNTELSQSAQKIRDLEESIKSGNGGKAMQEKLAAEEAKFARLSKEKDQRIAELEKKASITEKSADIKLLYGEVKKSFVKTLPPLFDKVEASVLSDVINNSVAKDGKLYMANPDGSIRKDNSYNEITVEAFLKSEFKDVIEAPKPPRGGAGSPPGGGGGGNDIDPAKITVDNFPMTDDIKTKDALHERMISLGLKQGDQNYRDIWKKYGLKLTA